MTRKELKELLGNQRGPNGEHCCCYGANMQPSNKECPIHGKTIVCSPQSSTGK